MNTKQLERRVLLATVLQAALVAAIATSEAGAQEEQRVRKEKRVSGERVEMQAVVVGEDGKVMRWHSSGDGTPIIFDADGHRTVVLDPAKGLGWIGVRMTGLSPELREYFGAAEDRGVLVAEVVAGGPAEVAGVEVGDVIVEVAGDPVASQMQVAMMVRGEEAGHALPMTVIRNGREQRLEVVVEHREAKRVFVRGGSSSGSFYESDEEIVGELGLALDGVRELLEGPELEVQVQSLKSFDWSTFEGRLAALEARIKELEGELEACQER